MDNTCDSCGKRETYLTVVVTGKGDIRDDSNNPKMKIKRLCDDCEKKDGRLFSKMLSFLKLD